MVERITGVKQRETIPDDVVRRADQIELIDQTPEALRRRMAHGNVYKSDRIDAALANYFRPGNLAALRELALLWLADRVDEGLEEYRERHSITEPWETRERVLVAITGAPGDRGVDPPRRRAWRTVPGASCSACTCATTTVWPAVGDPTPSSGTASSLTDLGGEYHEVVASDIAAALAELARVENVTQLVLGASRRSALGRAVPRLGHQPGDPPVGTDRPPHHLAGQEPTPTRISCACGDASSGAALHSRRGGASRASRSRSSACRCSRSG